MGLRVEGTGYWEKLHNYGLYSSPYIFRCSSQRDEKGMAFWTWEEEENRVQEFCRGT